jgi:hypothetical protein
MKGLRSYNGGMPKAPTFDKHAPRKDAQKLSSERGAYCANDGKPLTGKQEKWCSQKCAVEGWAKAHPAKMAAAQKRYVERKRAGLPDPAAVRQAEAVAGALLREDLMRATRSSDR